MEAPEAVSRAYGWIRERIFDGRLQPGEVLQEKLLGEAIGVSRTPVRSALAMLHAEGLVSYERYRRYTVAVLDDAEVERIFELRVMLEGLAARYAAKQVSEAEIAELSAICSAMEQIAEAPTRESVSKFDRLNARFHTLILGAANHPRLEKMLAGLVDLPMALLYRQIPEIERHFKLSCQQHRDILAALSQRNSRWAETLMQAHLLSLLPGEGGR